MERYYPLEPPELTDAQLDHLVEEIKDFQITHGSLVKLVKFEEEETVPSHPIGASLIPNQFPRECFRKATRIQTIYNELYAKISTDEVWLEETLKEYIEHDELTSILWKIHLETKRNATWRPQTLSLGIFRSDYMVHADHSSAELSEVKSKPELKQIEFNTYTVAGGVHANIIADLHQHLHRTGIYGSTFGDPLASPVFLPPNSGKDGIIRSLVAAHKEYQPLSSDPSIRTGVLMLVQPFNFNICDERPIEYGLWDQVLSIPTYRLIFGEEVLQQTSLGPSGELLFHPPHLPGVKIEVSVAYMRAGYEVREYDTVGQKARLRVERSRAIKCPSILCHMATFKKVQQQLAVPGVLERFLDDQKASEIRSTFATIYPMDESEQGKLGRKLALDSKTAINYVLKPSLEGGGNNVYGEDIPLFLRSKPERVWHTFILMELVKSPSQNSMLMSLRGIYAGPVLSELGILGTCLWSAEEGAEVMHNEQIGWTFKSKDEKVNEMSVIKGYGCFDSPWLVDIP